MRGQVAQSNDADQPLVAIQYGLATDLMLAHVLCDLGNFLIVEKVFDVLRNDFRDLRFSAFAFSDRSDGDITIGNHADQLVVLTDGNATSIQLTLPLPE